MDMILVTSVIGRVTQKAERKKYRKLFKAVNIL